ncbi:MAG: universal stress protein [Methanobacteriaceae archaeon]|nr:universal stress protein [Methanobacteriaceae archaeon]
MKKYTKVLVPTDGSEFADIAEKRALKLASEIDAEIIILTIAENEVSFGFRYKSAAKALSEALMEDAKAIIEHAKELAKDYSDVKIDYRILEGSPASVILDTVKEDDIDLLIIGSSSKSGVSKFVMGSVAERVVSYAECDVLVIHKVK